MRLFVGNVSDHATEAELREYFSAVGPLAFIYLPTDRESGKPRGIAFVEFTDAAQAEEAIRRFHQQPFHGKPLIVNQARAREPGAGVRKPPSWPPSLPSPDAATEPRGTDPRPSHKGGMRRAFGPDAAPRGQRKPAKRHPKSTRSPKGPMRERLSGQFFGGDDEEADHDAWHEGHRPAAQE